MESAEPRQALPDMKNRRNQYSRNTILVCGLLNTFVAGTIYPMMVVIDATYWMSHRTVGFIGLALVAIFSLKALDAFQKYFEVLSHWRRRSQDRRQVMPNSFAQGAFRVRRPFGLPMAVSPSRVYVKMQSAAPSPDSPLYLSPVKSQSLRSWYHSSAYTHNFPARREDCITDLKTLETFLRREEEKERRALLCGLLASTPTFWDCGRSISYYRRVLMEYQYQVACMPRAPFTHSRQPPVEERRCSRQLDQY